MELLVPSAKSVRCHPVTVIAGHRRVVEYSWLLVMVMTMMTSEND
jgi:hypothetical protein